MRREPPLPGASYKGPYEAFYKGGVFPLGVADVSLAGGASPPAVQIRLLLVYMARGGGPCFFIPFSFKIFKKERTYE